MRKFLIVCILLALSLPLVAQEAFFEPDACPFAVPEGESVECGYLIVPQDRSNPDEGDIELAVAILHSTASDTAPDPIIYLEGGPGGSALSGIDLWYDSPFRQRRDIVLFDQRGTGYSYPRLYCYEIDEIDPDLDDEAYMQAQEDATLACLDRFADEGTDISDYNSAASAADVADLGQALGYDSWNLYGVSYGTRLALTVMRDYPEGLRSVILDAVYPPVVDAYEEGPVNTYRVFTQLFDDCAADATCNQAYPDLEGRFYALVNRMNNQPEQIAELDYGELRGDDLVATIFGYFYDTRLVPYLPRLIVEMESSRYDTLIGIDEGSIPPGNDFDEDDPVLLLVDEFYYLVEELDDPDTVFMALEEIEYLDDIPTIIEEYFEMEDAEYLIDLFDELDDEGLARLEFELFWEDVSDTDGMFNAVECREELPFNSYADAETLAADLPLEIAASELIAVEEMLAVCETWADAGVADAIEDAAVVSDIPTLVLSGSFDPIPPPSWGEIAAETLSRSFVFEFPGVGHGAIDGGDCPVGIALAFLDDPSAAPDSACIAGMGVEFVMP